MSKRGIRSRLLSFRVTKGSEFKKTTSELGTVERMGASLDDTVFVGDSHVDVAAARGAGVPVIAVSFGYSLVDATLLGADIVIDRFPDLIPALDQL